MMRARFFPVLTRVSDLLHCPALLAIESEQAEPPARFVLDRAEAEQFGTALAADLAKLIDGIDGFDLICVGALFDQAQILRPGWPVHAALADLHTRLGTGERDARVVSIGAHDGKMPAPALDPDPRLHGSAMLLMPWLIRGEREQVAEIGARLEQDLLDRGMAGAGFALDLREQLGFPIRHVRHLTLYDLCALTCAQYEHAGLGPLWQVIEAALLAADREQVSELADGSKLHYHDGIIEAETRDQRLIAQCRAILAAHGLELQIRPLSN
jgi:hypothetical protein